METINRLYDNTHITRFSTTNTSKQISNSLRVDALKIRSVAEKIKKWNKGDNSRKKVISKFDSYLRNVIDVLKKNYKVDFSLQQVALGNSLLSIWESTLIVVNEVIGFDVCESMYNIILIIMNRSEFQPQHTIISSIIPSNDIICISEKYRELLYATYIHISEIYYGYEDLLRAVFLVNEKNYSFELTSERPAEIVNDSIRTCCTQDNSTLCSLYVKTDVINVPTKPKILFGLSEKKKQLKKEKKDRFDLNELYILEDDYFNRSGLSVYFLRFAPSALVILYFQLPLFQKLFLNRLSKFPSHNKVNLFVNPSQLKDTQTKFPCLFGWGDFHNYIKELGIDDQENKFDYCADSWLDLYHPGNDIFLCFYSQLVDLFLYSFTPNEINCGTVHGFDIITNVYLSEIIRPRRYYSFALKKTLKHLALLSPLYLSSITGLLLKSTNIFDFESVVDILQFITKLHLSYSKHFEIPNPIAYSVISPNDYTNSIDICHCITNKQIRTPENSSQHDSTITAVELITLFEKLISSDNCKVILEVLSTLFYILNVCSIDARLYIVNILISTWFDKFFLHWCSDIRKGYMHVLFYKGTINRRSHLNLNHFSKEESKLCSKIMQEFGIDLTEFDKTIVAKLEKHVKAVQRKVEEETNATLHGYVYFYTSFKEYNSMAKQYEIWDKNKILEPPPVQTEVNNVIDVY
ncbi:Uncharacterized protein QTN25_000255 [Entamoeba marina]